MSELNDGDYTEMTPVPAQGSGALLPASGMAVEISRAVQEAQGALLMAKHFPRDEQAARARINEACKRKGLAEKSTYAFNRGGSMIDGPSIRLAEVLAQHWGNLDFGVRELSRGAASSTWEAYAWDQQTNVRVRKTFEVPHVRHTKRGVVELRDPRDIYEMGANLAARRLRACILEVIPGYVVDEALVQCEKTLAGGEGPIADRVAKMVQAFGEISVTPAMIEARLGHKLEATAEAELVQLRKIYTGIRDGVSKREDWFDLTAAGSSNTAEELKAKLAAQKAKQQAPQPGPGSPAQPTGAPAEPGPGPKSSPEDTTVNCTTEAQRADLAKLLGGLKADERYKADVTTIMDALRLETVADTRAQDLIDCLKQEPPIWTPFDAVMNYAPPSEGGSPSPKGGGRGKQAPLV